MLEITTDIIVGYPTETDEDFMKSMDMVRSARFIKTHVFKFSKRKGTKTENLKSLDSSILTERSNKLIAFSLEIAKDKLSEYISKSLQILVEEKKGSIITGHTTSFIKVDAIVDNEANKNVEVNTFCNVFITGLSNEGLKGNILS